MGSAAPPPAAPLMQQRRPHQQQQPEQSITTTTVERSRHRDARNSSSPSTRLHCLDILRGLTVCLMIFVDFVGEGYSHLDHSPWNGFCLADIVMPAFLFMVGVSVPLALGKYTRASPSQGSSQPTIIKAWTKVGTRTIKLFGIGVLTQGAHLPRPGRPVFSGYNLKTVRWMGILQRIAIAYLIVGALEIVANALAAWLGKRTTSDGAAKAQDAHPIGEVDSGDSQDASHIHAFKQAAEEKDDASQVLLLVVDDGDNSGRLHSRRRLPRPHLRAASSVLSSLAAFRLNCLLHLSAIVVLTLIPVFISLSQFPSDYTFHHTTSNGTVLIQTVDCSDTSEFSRHLRLRDANRQMGGGGRAWFSINPVCNLYRQVDAKVLGGMQHLYKSPEYRRLPACSGCSPWLCDPEDDSPAWCAAPFDPEGFLSSISASATACVGALFAISLMAVIKRRKKEVDRPASDPLLVPLSPGNKPDSSSILALLSAWLLVSVLVLLVPGLALHCGDVIPLNKNIWSVSYFLFTAGVSGVMLAVLYGVVDSPWRVGAVGMILQPFRWVGLNAILVYLGAATDLLDSALSCFFFDDPKNNMYNMMYSVVCSHAGESQPPLSNHCDAGIMIGVQAKVALLVITLFRILFWIIVAGVLHWKKWYWAL